MMDPKTQECVSFFLYGAGFHAKDENTLAIVTGQKNPPHFCLSCIRRDDCQTQHAARVREMMPEEAETFDRLMAEGTRRGMPPTLTAALLAKDGRDPFAAVAVDNFKRGHADRGVRDGTLTK
jgi:hypothetical protein